MATSLNLRCLASEHVLPWYTSHLPAGSAQPPTASALHPPPLETLALVPAAEKAKEGHMPTAPSHTLGPPCVLGGATNRRTVLAPQNSLWAPNLCQDPGPHRPPERARSNRAALNCWQ